MSMHNSDKDFYGKQDGERILYVIRPHPLATTLGLARIYLIAVVICLAVIIVGVEVEGTIGSVVTVGIILFLLIIFAGTKIVLDWQARNISYITDRRLVHFEPTTLFATK